MRKILVTDYLLEDIENEEINDEAKTKLLEEFLHKQVEEMIILGKKYHKRNPQCPEIPLLRISVDTEGKIKPFNAANFARKYDGKIANKSISCKSSFCSVITKLF